MSWRRWRRTGAAHPRFAHFENGDLASSIAVYKELLRLDANDATAHYYLGLWRSDQAYFEGEERTVQAARHFKTLVELEPDNVTALTKLAVTLQKLDRVDEVLPKWEGTGMGRIDIIERLWELSGG